MNKAFRCWLGSRFFSNFGKQIQSTVVAWQIFKLTQDPLSMGFLGLAEAIPFVASALWAGHLVDRHEKRKMMLRAEVGLLLSSVAFVFTAYVDRPPLLLLYVIVGFAGLCSSFENISASAYGQLLISKEHFPKAMGWNLGLFQMALISGPLLAGWLLVHLDERFIYALAGVCLCVSLIHIWQLHPIQIEKAPREQESAFKRVKYGLKFIWSQPMILAAMSLDMVAVLFGDVVALYPFVAAQLGAGSIGYGFLKASPGLGSGVVSAIQAAKVFVRPGWKSLRIVVSIFGLCMIFFALSPNIYLAALCLAIGGAADGVSVIIRQTIYQGLTPDHLRGRVASVSSIFIATSNEVGMFESGLVAKWMGVVPSILFGGTICLISVGAMTLMFRKKIVEDVL